MEATKRREGSAGIGGSILGGTISLTVSNLAVKILGLIYKIPLARLLGDEGMGYFNSAYTVFGLFYLLCTAGVPKAVMILCSKNEDGELCAANIVKIAMKVFFCIGLSVSLLFTVFSFPIARLIGNGGAAFTMIAIAPSILFLALGGVIRGFLSSYSGFLDIAVGGVIEGVARLAIGLVFGNVAMKLGFSLELVSAMTILGTTLGSIFSFAYLYKCAKNKKSNEKAGQKINIDQKKGVINRIFKISVPITLGAAVMSLTGVIDLTLVMRRLKYVGFSEAEASALYGNYTTLAVSMFNFALSVITPISIIFLPRFVKAISEKDEILYKNTLDSSFTIISFVAAPMTFGLFLFSYEILSLIFGAEAATVGAELLSLLSPSIMLSSLLLMVNTVLEAEGMVRIPVYSMLFGGVFKIICGYFLIGDARVGICGAPIGTVISYLLALAFSLSCAYLKKCTLPIFGTAIIPYFCAGVSVTLSKLLYFSIEKRAGEVVSILVAIAFCALIYIGISALFGMFSKLKIALSAKYTNFA